MTSSAKGMARELQWEWGPNRGLAGWGLRSLGGAREGWGRFIARGLW